jgi:tetratricopeptide (TPR) repeat protein
VLASAAIVLLCLPCRSQSPVLTLLRGEIKSDRVLLQGYCAELYDFNNRQNVDRTYVHNDGEFDFHNVPYGDYQLRVTNSAGEIVHQQFVTVGITTPLVEVRLLPETIQRPPSGPVSVKQLQHPPTRKAFAEFAAAQRFSESGQYDKAAEELEKAIKISPAYAEAYTNLAAQHFRMGRYEEALADSKRAMELSSPNAVDLGNMAFALLRLQRYPEAVDAARAAVRIDPGNDKSRYLLGTLLVMNWATIQEGIKQLERVAGAIPSAHVNLDAARKMLAQGPPR